MSAQWTDAAAFDGIEPDDMIGVDVQGTGVALYRIDDEVFATALQCTHGDARLCDGWLQGHEIVCPLHQGRFDLRTGEATFGPAYARVRVFPVRVVDGRIQVDLAPQPD